jgi:phage terminase large subunit-like protein
MQQYDQSVIDKLKEKYKNNSISQQELKYLYKAQIENCRNSFPAYCAKMLPFITGDKTAKFAWFQHVIMDELDGVFNDPNDLKRMILRMPDQHSKTMLAGLCAASYLLGKYPNGRGAYITYSDKRAKTPCSDILRIVSSDEYRKIFPEFKLPDDLTLELKISQKRQQKLSVSHFTNANSPEGYQGGLSGFGITSGAVGFSYDWIIMDDLFNGFEEANSPVIHESRWNIFLGNILSRQQKNTIMLLFGTWWHPDDVIGRLERHIKEKQENNEPMVGWKNIVFNAQKDERDYPYDHRKIGEYLFPELKMNYYLDMKALAPLMWQIKCQNIVVDFAKKLFHPDDFQWYMQEPDHFQKKIITIDPNNGKQGKKTDDCAVNVLGFKKPKVYIVETLSLNMIDVIEQARQVAELVSRHPDYDFVLLEDSANGMSLYTILTREYFIRCRMFNPRGKFASGINENLTGGKIGKYERAYSVQCYFKNGQIVFPHKSVNPKIAKVYKQFINFTGEDYAGSDDAFKDDHVDSIVQALIEMEKFMRAVPQGRLNCNIPIDMPKVGNNMSYQLSTRNNIRRPIHMANGFNLRGKLGR